MTISVKLFKDHSAPPELGAYCVFQNSLFVDSIMVFELKKGTTPDTIKKAFEQAAENISQQAASLTLSDKTVLHRREARALLGLKNT